VLGVCRGGGTELIGHVGLSPQREGVEIGYAIEAKHQGEGLATEAVRAAVGWGMRRFALDCIFGIASCDNVASCRVLERAGFALWDESVRTLHHQRRLVRTYRATRSR
jgi:RimJ/RimL family protein N-acetyltransferase